MRADLPQEVLLMLLVIFLLLAPVLLRHALSLVR